MTVIRKRLWFLLIVLFFASPAMEAIEKEPLQEYRSRRERLVRSVQDSVVVLFAAPDQDLVEYRQENNFYYLTGFDEPDAMLLLDASSTPFEEYLFIPPRRPAEERWTGEKLGPGADAERKTGFQHVLPSSEFAAVLGRTAARGKTVYGLKEDFERTRAIVSNLQMSDVGPLVAALRQVKSATELALLERAIQITMKAHEAAARTIAPGVMEYEVEAAIEYEFRRNGAERPGFPSIVGSGPFSTILHYDKSTRKMEAGDVVVVDIGAEYGGYSADITRTYPVSGKFSPRQREIYQIVLDAQDAGIRAVKPGVSMGNTGIHKVTSDLIRSKGYGNNFIHGTSHHIGLHVHDVGSTNRLEPGMVITVEPGIYIPEEQLGVRIEDDILVTADGYRILSDFPRKIADIEALMARGR
jgi:Xaa-Pro aminopeptidase